MYAGTSRVQTRCHEYSTRPLRPSRPRPRRRLNSRPVSPLACNGYSYSPFIAKPKAARGLCFRQLGGHVELPRLMRKYDVIRTTGSTYRIATAPQQDRAAATRYMHKNSAKIGRVYMFVFLEIWLFSCTSTNHSTDLVTTRGVAHLVVHGTTGSTSYETIPPVRLETSGGVLSTVDMVVQRRDGPRQLRDHDDDDDDMTDRRCLRH